MSGAISKQRAFLCVFFAWVHAKIWFHQIRDQRKNMPCPDELGGISLSHPNYRHSYPLLHNPSAFIICQGCVIECRFGVFAQYSITVLTYRMHPVWADSQHWFWSALFTEYFTTVVAVVLGKIQKKNKHWKQTSIIKPIQ